MGKTRVGQSLLSRVWSAPTRLWWPVLAVVGACLALTAFAFDAVSEAEEARIRNAVELRVEWHAKDIEGKLDATREPFVATAIFAAAHDSFDSEAFRRFTSRVRRQGRPISALDWVPRVAGKDRAAF